MSSRSIQHIEDLSPHDMDLLTQLLTLPSHEHLNSPTWQTSQKLYLTDLPPRLKRSRSVLPRLATALVSAGKKAHLCHTHKSLDPQLIRRIFLQVSAECTIRISSFANGSNLPKDVLMSVQRLQKLNSLWIAPDLYRVMVQAMPSDWRYERIKSECEACILATIGGNIEALSDLRASMRGRRKRGRQHSRLLSLIEAWIDSTHQGDEIRFQSNLLCMSVKQCRRQLQNERRAAKGPSPKQQRISSWVDESNQTQEWQETGDENNDYEEHDFEWSIIDWYGKYLSTADLLPRSEDLHPAFRESFWNPSGKAYSTVNPRGQSSTSGSSSLEKPSSSSRGSNRTQPLTPHPEPSMQGSNRPQTLGSTTLQQQNIKPPTVVSEWMTEYHESEESDEDVPLNVHPPSNKAAGLHRQASQRHEPTYRMLSSLDDDAPNIRLVRQERMTRWSGLQRLASE